MALQAFKSAPRLAKAALAAGLLGAAAITASAIPASGASQVLIVGFKGNEAALCGSATHNIRTNIWPLSQVENGCGTRVWLHQNTDGSGWTYCVSPHSVTGFLQGKYQYAGQFYVSTNTANC